MKRSTSYILLALAATLTLLVIGTAVLLPRILHLDSYKEEILAQMEQALNRRVSYEKGEFSFRFGPAFTFTKVAVKERDGSSHFVTAERLTFKLAVLPLLEKKVVLREMVLYRPVILITRAANGVFNISDLLEAKKEQLDMNIRELSISQGTIRFADTYVNPNTLFTTLDQADLFVDGMTRGKSSRFKLSATVVERGNQGSLLVGGKATLAPKGKPFTTTTAILKITAKNLESSHYWDYYSHYVPFQKMHGKLGLDATFKGSPNAFASKGTIQAAGLNFNYPQVFHAPLTPRNLRVAYTLGLDPDAVKVPTLTADIDGLKVNGTFAIGDIRSKDPRIIATTSLPPFKLEKFRHYIPFGIISRDTSEFIEKHIWGGTFRVEEGRLDGRVSQIAHMEVGDNNKVLTVHGRALGGGLLIFGSGVPTFSNIRGELELAGKNFTLKNMAGTFGTSPFTLNGKITDYCMDNPSSYPFTMTMTPHQGELAWLAGSQARNRLTFNGASTLRLTGEGLTSAYTLAGTWDLTSAAYSYPDIITKAAGKINNLSFRGTIVNKQEVQLTALQFSLPPLAFSASGHSLLEGKHAFSFDLRTTPFAIHEVTSMLPYIARYQPAGKIETAVHGESGTGKISDTLLTGWLSLTGASFKPSESVKPLSGIAGIVRFRGNSLETSQLTARLGSSIITGKGNLSNFKNPSFSLTFSAPALNPADFGLRSTSPVQLGRTAGTISLKDETLQIQSFSTRINASTFNLSGLVRTIRTPAIDISVTSPFLELNDLMLLARLESGTAGRQPLRVTVKADLNAESGTASTTPFRKLHTAINYENSILYLKPFECQLLGGTLNGSGRFDLSAPNSPRYQFAFNLGKVAADQLLQAAGVKQREITGSAYIQGDLTAKGDSSTALRKSALGSIKVRFEEGTLRKFSVLSKIFSILNVSQLFKLQLPDMVSGGMPYNTITADIAVRDGIATTKNLFVDSDAMNISAVGSADIVREELDLTIGVKPLQTVDKVVSHIPIVGWLLTGKDKSLLGAYFEAKGNWDNPTVSAIPVKSIAKGVFDIFKRTFQLPARLFTDTGEVLGQ